MIGLWPRLLGRTARPQARKDVPPAPLSGLELPAESVGAPLLNQLRHDLMAIEPDALRQLHIARASEHLAATLEITHAALNQIRRACDALEARAAAHHSAETPLARSAVKLIRESCRAQEVSVGRLRKVASTLDYIGSRLGGLESALQVPTPAPANSFETLEFERSPRGGRA
jgi:hypothetical protein